MRLFTQIVKPALALSVALTVAACGEDETTFQQLPDSAFDIDHLAEVTALGGDPERGERLFRPCASCHRIDAAANRTGPHLLELFGRQAGSIEGYRYSVASLNSQVVWSVETLSGYLTDPHRFMPGTRMNYPGVDADDLPDLLMFLYVTGGEARRGEAED